MYLRCGQSQPVDWTVNPLGLVLHNRLITLVCTMGNYCELKDVRTMLLHRMQTAERISKDASVPEGFSLDDYLATGAFGYRKRLILARSMMSSPCPLSSDRFQVEPVVGKKFL